jgi:hypothetical protein
VLGIGVLVRYRSMAAVVCFSSRVTPASWVDRQDQDAGVGNPDLLHLLPHRAVDPTQLSEDEAAGAVRRLHLQIRYNRAKQQAILRVTIYAEAIGTLTKKIHTMGSPDLHNKIHNDATAPVASTSATGARSMLSVHPACQHTNPQLIIEGPEFAVAPVHAKVRRDGYHRSERR